MSGASSGFISGAAGGASVGSSWGPWGAAVGGVVGSVLGGISGASNDEQFENQQSWINYNARSEYNISMDNIAARSMLTKFNVGNIMAGAEESAEISRAVAEYNVGMITATTDYNDSLLESDIADIWEEMELDLSQLAHQREVERGEIVATQAASGTVIGEGSNADVIVDQMTQEAMDAFIVRRGADSTVRDINNNRAKSMWEGTVAVQKAMWDGEMAAYTTLKNARTQSAGMVLEGAISATADTKSAQLALTSRLQGLSMNQDSYSLSNSQNMMSSLFGAAATAGDIAYRSKSVVGQTDEGNLYSTASRTNYERAVAGSPSWERGLQAPGSSLI